MAPPNPFDDDPTTENITPNGSSHDEKILNDQNNFNGNQQQRPIDDQTNRARRRREEAVSRLVADATRFDPHRDETSTSTSAAPNAQHSTLLLASTVASSIERGLDREVNL